MPTSTGQQLSTSQLTRYAYDAGFRGQSLATIVAIAEAESRGFLGATNSYTANGHTYGVYGPLQLSTENTGVTQGLAENPATAFAYAYGLSKGGSNFSPWETFTNHAYVPFLSAATQAVSQLMSQNFLPPETFGLPPGAVGSYYDEILHPTSSAIPAMDSAGTAIAGGGPATHDLDYGLGGQFGLPVKVPGIPGEKFQVTQVYYQTPDFTVHDYTGGPVPQGSGILVALRDVVTGGIVEYEHLSGTMLRRGEMVTAGQFAGYTGGPTSSQFGSGNHLAVITDAKGYAVLEQGPGKPSAGFPFDPSSLAHQAIGIPGDIAGIPGDISGGVTGAIDSSAQGIGQGIVSGVTGGITKAGYTLGAALLPYILLLALIGIVLIFLLKDLGGSQPSGMTDAEVAAA